MITLQLVQTKNNKVIFNKTTQIPNASVIEHATYEDVLLLFGVTRTDGVRYWVWVLQPSDTA